VHGAATVYSPPFLVLRLLAELLTGLKRVVVYWVCIVLLLLPGQSGYIPTGAIIRWSSEWRT
jgi:hypothetical protein